MLNQFLYKKTVPVFFAGKKSGFVLGIVFMCLMLAAVFIFSYNSIVRHQNLRAHHEKISSMTESLARAGVLLLTEKLGNKTHELIQVYAPVLKSKTAEETGPTLTLNSLDILTEQVRTDFQTFLNSSEEIAYKESGFTKYPVCNDMKISLDKIKRLTPSNIINRGHDPIEKYGQIIIECEVEYKGLIRRATAVKNFRVVSMVPGPFARFSLFVSQTPDPLSYNSMGINLSGATDHSFIHPSLPKKVNNPLVVINGTDSQSIEDVADSNKERTLQDDKNSLLKRGWIFIGPTISNPSEAIYLKIPTGIEQNNSGLFMFGLPSNGKLEQWKIYDPQNFSEFPDLDFDYTETYYGFFTGPNKCNGTMGLWTGFPNDPQDARMMSASTWIYPYGNKNNLSRTLVVGNVLAGYLKLCLLKAKNSSYKIVFKGIDEADFNNLAIDGATNKISSLGLHDPNHSDKEKYDQYLINDYFKSYESFKLLFPFNSCVSKDNFAGISFNAIFDFMKYKRQTAVIPTNPGIATSEFEDDEIRVPGIKRMNENIIKGIHPYDKFGIYFKENGNYDFSSFPDNCYFYGDLTSIRPKVGVQQPGASNSNLYERVTEIIDITKAKNVREETDIVENFLFRPRVINGNMVNVPRRAGIFHLIRKEDVSTHQGEAIIISRKPIVVTEPFVILVSNGSIEIPYDIISPWKDGAPENLASIIVEYGNVYLTNRNGGTDVRRLDAFLCALGVEDPTNKEGRLLSDGQIKRFQINGGLAVKEIGFHTGEKSKNLDTTMIHFVDGGRIKYNPRFNPSLPSYQDSYEFITERTTPKIIITGGSI
jgi:hypothetical protein